MLAHWGEFKRNIERNEKPTTLDIWLKALQEVTDYKEGREKVVSR